MNIKPEDIITSIVTYLRKELARDTLNSESKEGVEVAIECLCKAYDIPDNVETDKSINLEILFENYLQDESNIIYNNINFNPTEEAKLKAEEFKNAGNLAMQQDKPDLAIIEYSKAIECDNSNPVYYCNRAASHNKLKNSKLALRDCRVAIKLDPNYAKAYGRMGLAYTQMEYYKSAYEAYTKAAELDPNDPLYANNVQAAMSNVNSPPNLNEFSNRFLSDPSIQQLFGSLMTNTGAQNVGSGSGVVGGNSNQGIPNQGIQALLRASQQMASQLEQRNPQLVDQILQQFGPALNNLNPPRDDLNNGQ